MTDAVLLRRMPCSGFARAVPTPATPPRSRSVGRTNDARSQDCATGDFGELGSTAAGIAGL